MVFDITLATVLVQFLAGPVLHSWCILVHDDVVLLICCPESVCFSPSTSGHSYWLLVQIYGAIPPLEAGSFCVLVRRMGCSAPLLLSCVVDLNVDAREQLAHE